MPTIPTLKIVMDDAIPYAQEIFGHLAELTLLPGKSIQAKDVQEADALIIRSRTQINAELLDNSQVKFVGSTVVGLDHIDQNYLQQKGIAFYSAQGCNANSVAEFVINALFEVAEAKQFDLTTKTLGIIGVGNVGSRLYQKAQTLGIQCIVNDPPKQQHAPNAYKYHTLQQVLQADIISVHTPLTKNGNHPTADLLSAEILQSITPNQIVINAARGGIINENAWTNTPTLANIIDCWENEPNINESLYHTAFFATPHIAGHSFEAKIAGSRMVYQALCDYLKIRPITNWESSLPQPQQSIPIDTLENEAKQNPSATNKHQTILQKVFRMCHNIHDDHQGIQATTYPEMVKKYEHFRRNYPIYHEWHQHHLNNQENSEPTKSLKLLGFISK